jgi:hypothetical protein
MKTVSRLLFGILATIFLFAAPSLAALPFVDNLIEPDDYADRTVLNDIHPRVQLRIFDGVIRDDFPNDFGVFPAPNVIPVTANDNRDIFGGHFTSTGTKSFGHANITFFPESRQLAMRFLAPTTDVSIDFIGTSTQSSQIGVLEVFNRQGMLLDTFSSGQLSAHQIATLSLSRPAGDIGYARAFSSPDGSPFGTLDNLRFVTIPEPAAFVLAAMGASFVAIVAAGRHCREFTDYPLPQPASG